jgi:hypothetical protein
MAPPAAEAVSFWDIPHLSSEVRVGPWASFPSHLCYNTNCHLACEYWGRRQTDVVINCNYPEL